jgi:hypothetical protein
MLFGLQSSPSNKSSVQTSFQGSSVGETYDKAYQRLIQKLDHEAKQKEQEDKDYRLQLQLIKEEEQLERTQQRQLKKAHAEILRRQTEEARKRRLMQRSFDLSPAFDQSVFPVMPAKEKVSKAQRQQQLAQELEQQVKDKQRKYAERKHLDAEYEASQVSEWRSQLEIARISAINDRLKVKEDLTKSWSDNQRTKSIMQYIEGKAKVKPLEDSPTSRELPSIRGSPKVRSPKSIELPPSELVNSKPVPKTDFRQSPARLGQLTRRDLALQLQEQIKQQEVNSLKTQIMERAKRLSSQSPAPSYHKHLIEEAASLLVTPKQTQVQNEGQIRRRKQPNSPRRLDPLAVKQMLSSIKRSAHRTMSQYGRNVVGE